MSGSDSRIPVQYKASNGLFGILVVDNTDENKEYVEELFCKLLGSEMGKGTLTFGPPGTEGEAVSYNEGYTAGFEAALVINTPDLIDEKTGETLIRGNKKRTKV